METKEASTTKSKELIKRNPGMPLELDWVNAIRVNKSAIERRVATLPKRRSIKKQWQAAWLLKAVSCIDLTTLAGDDTPGRVERLCHKAKQPVRQDILEGFGVADLNLTVGAVCVYHQMIPVALQALKDSEVPIAAVSTGFPDGLSPFEQRVEEIKASVAAGAEEIDIVITRQHVLTANWESLYSEIAAFREACGEAHLKVILGTGNLATLRNIAKASLVAMMAGADFIKTSTGKESENATLEVSLIMVRMIRDYY
ncbi:MAG: deoxyribose-phosphate aldolase, partial [Candidatus Kariarchaeaceae archaeon]